MRHGLGHFGDHLTEVINRKRPVMGTRSFSHDLHLAREAGLEPTNTTT